MLLAKVAVALLLSQYVRTRVDKNDPTSQCLWWKEGTVIQVEQSETGNPETPGETEFAATTAAYSTWGTELARCGNLSFEELARSSSRTIADDGKTLVLFRQVDCDKVNPPCTDPTSCGNERDCWEHSNGALAITTTSFEGTTGRISDSDIELNTPGFIFSTVEVPRCVDPFYSVNCVASDVQNTLTHEFGHVLGLAHSPDGSSTMFAGSVPGELSKRSLDAASKQFVCDVYPAGKATRTCKIAAFDGELGKAKGCTAMPAMQLLGLALLLLRSARTRRR